MAHPSPPPEAPFPLVLAHHHRERSTGTLLVLCPPHRKKIYIQEGAVVFAGSDDRNDRLGEMLVRRGALRLVDFLGASSSLPAGTRFGTFLVERRLLSAEQLVWAVKEQVKEIVFSLFHVTASACEFVSGAAAGEEIITLNINTPELLRIGVERFDRISAPLEPFRNPALELRLVHPPAALAALLKLDDSGASLLEGLRAPSTLAKLMERSPLPDFQALKLLWTLWALDLLTAGPAQAPATQEEDFGITAEDLSDL